MRLSDDVPRQQLGLSGTAFVSALFILIGIFEIWRSYRVDQTMRHVQPLRFYAKHPRVTRAVGVTSIGVGLAVLVAAIFRALLT